jgi:hypothetical protein
MKGGSTTRVATVVATLLEGLPKVMPDGVEVRDGDLPEEQPDHALIVAPADPDTPGIAVTYGQMPNRGPAEQIEIALVARSYSGDQNMPARRDKCAAIIAGVQKYVRENARVEDRWDQIEIGPTALWQPVHTTAGSNCYVGFSLVTTGLL